jgi:hypothetical protein
MRAYPFTPSGESGTCSKSRMMSISQKIILRLAVTTLVATAVAYGWLYVKAARVQDYLDQRALVQQAREISDFISVNANGSFELNLPSSLVGSL